MSETEFKPRHFGTSDICGDMRVVEYPRLAQSAKALSLILQKSFESFPASYNSLTSVRRWLCNERTPAQTFHRHRPFYAYPQRDDAVLQTQPTNTTVTKNQCLMSMAFNGGGGQKPRSPPHVQVYIQRTSQPKADPRPPRWELRRTTLASPSPAWWRRARQRGAQSMPQGKKQKQGK